MINHGAEFGSHLESGEDAIVLMSILNKIPIDDFIIDFKEVMFVTMNFAQAYYIGKSESSKKISEINFSDCIKFTMGAADEAVNP